VVFYYSLAGLHWLGSFLGDWINYALYPLSLVAVLIGLCSRWMVNDSPVHFAAGGGAVFPRAFGHIFYSVTPAIFGVFFVLCFVCQVAVLRWTPNHGGLAIEGGFRESLLLTLDNLCKGLSLGAFEFLDIHIGEKVRHTHFSSTVFWLFRLAYTWLV